MGIMLRNWLEVRKILLEYLITTEESYFGTVIRIFARDEYQDALKSFGNLPHIHMLLCTKEKPWREHDKKKFENIIRGHIDDLARDCEIQEMVDGGFLDKAEDIWEVQNDASKYLLHKCSDRCMRRVGPSPDDLVCHVADNYKQSPDHRYHSYSDKQPKHVKEAMDVMLQMNLMEKISNAGDDYKATHLHLSCEKHFPPTMRPNEKIFPAVKEFFFLQRNNQNRCNRWTEIFLF